MADQVGELHYVEVAKADSVLVDLGGFGLELEVAADGEHYDVRYVKIDYDRDDQADATHLRTGMAVSDRNDDEVHVPDANKVRIWRHE